MWHPLFNQGSGLCRSNKVYPPLPLTILACVTNVQRLWLLETIAFVVLWNIVEKFCRKIANSRSTTWSNHMESLHSWLACFHLFRLLRWGLDSPTCNSWRQPSRLSDAAAFKIHSILHSFKLAALRSIFHYFAFIPCLSATSWHRKQNWNFGFRYRYWLTHGYMLRMLSVVDLYFNNLPQSISARSGWGYDLFSLTLNSIKKAASRRERVELSKLPVLKSEISLGKFQGCLRKVAISKPEPPAPDHTKEFGVFYL